MPVRFVPSRTPLSIDSRPTIDDRLPIDVFLESLHQRAGAFCIARDDEDRVVAADRADRFRQLRAVDGDRQGLCLSDTGADDDELLHLVDAAQVFLRCPLEGRQSRFRIRRFCAGTLIRPIAGALDEAELLDVPGNRRLRRLEAAMSQAAAELFLAMQRLAIDELDDHGLAARLHRSKPPLYIEFC